MSFEIRKLDLNKDYKELFGWWKDWGWDPFPKQLLPETGLMVFDGEKNICAGWIYKTDTKICWLENIISNKDYKDNRNTAISMLVEALGDEAKALGFSVVMTATKSKGLINKYRKVGYIGTDEEMQHFLKVL